MIVNNLRNQLWVTSFHCHSLKILRLNQAQIMNTANSDSDPDSSITPNVAIPDTFELPINRAENGITINNENFDCAVQNIKVQWQRITDILENDSNAAYTNILTTLTYSYSIEYYVICS